MDARYYNGDVDDREFSDPPEDEREMDEPQPTKTIRQRITTIQRELRDGALTPDMARESLVTLTALLGNVNDEQRAADSAYKHVLLDALKTHAKANRARIEAECSPEYLRAREAKDTETLVIEMIRSCKAYLRSLSEEMRLAG
jgi:hypothetical protein